VDTCYARYKEKHAKRNPGATAVDIDHFDYFAFHTPYNKLVQKGFARLMYVDSVDAAAAAAAGGDIDTKFESVQQFVSMPVQETYESRDVETAYKNLSASRLKIIVTCCISMPYCIRTA
jgi:hydroxymethylglutaryl-CoA synthase